MARPLRESLGKYKKQGRRQQKIILACVLSFIGVGLWHNMPIFKQVVHAWKQEIGA